MSKGYVYVLTNESMPGLVKVGKTNREPHLRAQELYQTGVPTPFEVYAEYLCPDCSEVEKSVHKILGNHRVNTAREFFKCPVEKAARVVMGAQRSQVNEMVGEYLPGHEVVRVNESLHISDVGTQLHQCNVRDSEFIGVMCQISSTEMAALVARYREERSNGPH